MNQVWAATDGAPRSGAALCEAALSDLLVAAQGAPRSEEASARCARLRTLSLDVTSTCSWGDRWYDEDGAGTGSWDDLFEEGRYNRYQSAEESAQADGHEEDRWLAAHPLRHFPPLPSSTPHLLSLAAQLRAACKRAMKAGGGSHALDDRTVDRLERLLAAAAAAQVSGGGAASFNPLRLRPAPPPPLFPQLESLSIVGAGSLRSVELGSCPNLTQLKLLCCGSLFHIDLGGTGRHLTSLALGGVRLSDGSFQNLLRELDHAGCRLRECALGVPPLGAGGARWGFMDRRTYSHPPDVDAGRVFEEYFLASAPRSDARLLLGGTQTFLSTSVMALTAHPRLLGELRAFSLHGGWWQCGARLHVLTCHLAAFGLAAPVLEQLTMTQPRWPEGLKAKWFQGSSDAMAPACLLSLGLPGAVAGRSPFPRLRTLVLDGQECTRDSGIPALLRQMPRLERFELVYNALEDYLVSGSELDSEDCGVVKAEDSAPFAAALRHLGLSVYRSHHRVRGFVGELPKAELEALRRELCTTPHSRFGLLDCGHLPPRGWCDFEWHQKDEFELFAEEEEAGLESGEFVLERCAVCDELNERFNG